MRSMNKVMFCLLGGLLLATSVAFAQGEDFFVGTWQGRVSGEGLSNSFVAGGRWKTGFEMDIILKVAERRFQSPEEGGGLVRPVSGWATVHYRTPELINPDYRAEVKIESRSGQIDGAIRTSMYGWPGGEEAWNLDLSYDQVLPEGTWVIYHLCSEPECDLPENPCPPISGSIKDVGLLGVERHLTAGGNLKVMPNKDSIALHEELKGGPITLMPPHGRKMMERIMGPQVEKGMQQFFGEGGMFASEHKLTGMLYKVQGQEHILGDTIELNELITTDKHTRKEITIPNVGEVVVNTDSEVKFESPTSLSIFKGEMKAIIRKLEPHQFEIRTPVSIIGVRGTQFLTNVEKDGTTTLTVLEGTVEFSDLDKKKTVVVKKNQRSVVKPGDLPSEPISIDEKRIPIWWE